MFFLRGQLARWLSAVFILVGCGACSTSSIYVESLGKSAPYTRVRLVEGGYKPLAAYQGKNVVLFFWSSWCPHCRRAAPKMEALARTYSARADTVFIAVSVDRGASDREVLRVSREEGIQKMKLAFSGNGFYDEAFLAFKVQEIPHMILLDKNGVIRARSSSVSDIAAAISGL